MKRMTETNKWSDPWFRKLSHQAKLLWFYLVDHCDNIGLVEIDLPLVSSDCGTKITEDHLLEMKDRIQILDDGKIFLPKFIPFQYGTLSESCIPHKKVLEAIRFHSLTPTFKGYAYPSARVATTLPSRVNTRQEEDRKGKEEDKTVKTRARDIAEVEQFCRESGLFPRDADYLWNKWESNGWTNGGKAIKDWRATARAWKAQGYLPSQKTPSTSDCWPSEPAPQAEEEDLMAKMMRRRAEEESKRHAAEGEAPESTGGPELW
jgi:hypothetical protein